LKSWPRISVVVLTYNGDKFIDALLNSLYHQNYSEECMEILVVDNASTDNTRSIVETKYPNVILISLTQNYGFAAGNNLAVSYTKYDHIVFLNQDTICHQGWLKGLVEGLLQDNSIGACASNMIMCEDPASCETTKTLHFGELYYYDINLFGYGVYCKSNQEIVFPKIISGCSFIIRKQTIQSLGYLFDEDLKMYTEDTDLSLRIYNHGLRVCVSRKSVVFHLHGKNSKINFNKFTTAARAIRNRVLVFYKNLSWMEFLLYFPVLILGGPLKLFHFPFSTVQKILFFVPFSLFSMGCMLSALFVFPSFVSKRKQIMKARKVRGAKMLRLLFNKF
jgi:GT2 family glycosyltransferase